MKVIVKPHSIQVISTPVNELEVNVTTVEFEFSEEITNDFVKEAYFTLDNDTYKQVIVNNECEIPSEVLTKVGTVELGVVAYYADPVSDELVRYNPKPGYFTSWEGSLRDAENSQPITPSEMEQYEQALNDGLEELDNALDDLQEKVDSGYFKGDKGDTGERGPAGPAGRDGYVQYTAGDNITIENNVISATGGDLSNYYTKSDIDQRLPILTIFLNSINPFSFSSLTLNDTETLASASNVINKFYSLGNKNGFLLNRVPDSGAIQSQMFVSGTLLDVQITAYAFYGVPTYFDGLYYNRSITINGNWANNVFTATYVTTTGGSTFVPTNYLAKNNTSTYTPTSNYNPATKKYVDDKVASAITDALGGNY